jgi:tetratricopeptide (TPR) repeat protein
MILHELPVVIIAFWCITQSPADPARAASTECADGLFAAGLWDAAITEYKRHLFLDPESPSRDHCYEQIAGCYRELGNLQASLETLRFALEQTPGDSLRSERRLDIGELLLAMDVRPLAELEFSRVQAFCRYAPVRRRATERLVTLQLETFRWRDARSSLSRAEGSVLGSERMRMDSVFARMESVAMRSPTTAKNLSSVMPGLGQMYAGSWIRGIHSFALNALCAALVVHSVRESRVALAVFSVSLFTRYYQGGRYHAARLAAERNNAKLRPEIERALNGLRRGEGIGVK